MNDGGRPTEVAVQAEASNYPKVLRAKVVVLSVGEKAAVKPSGMCHGDERK
jgi:hypothetical protein